MTQARRALKRLIGVKLVEVVEPGHGRVATVYRLRWWLPSFPQPFVPSFPAPLSQGKEKRAPEETPARPTGAAGVKDLPIRRPPKALRWAMFRLRREVSSWGLPPPRRENLLWGLGNAVWRALKRGIIRTTAQLRRLVAELIASLQSVPEGVSATLRRACGYAGAITLMALRSTVGAVDPKEVLRRKLEALRLQYLQPWLSPEERARIAEEGKRIAAALRGLG